MKFKEINPSPRTLMTPGPVEADPRVLRAMGAHILGQFDPEFTALMNETMEMERYVFQTQNKMTYLVDTTSRGGLETVLTGAICPGDKVLIPAFGRFGYLLAEILERCGADITLLEREWGTVFEPEEIEEALKKDSYKAVAFIHGETSTSMMQPLKEIGEICEKYGALLIVDAVATLGGAEVHVDDWKLSACISGTQKCISAPSGSALITYNEQIEEMQTGRKPVKQQKEDFIMAQKMTGALVFDERTDRYRHCGKNTRRLNRQLLKPCKNRRRHGTNRRERPLPLTKPLSM